MDAVFQYQLRLRWLYLCVSVVLLLCLGLIYAWSVFRVPLEAEFGWSKAETSVTFSISMMMFCLGGVASGILTERKGARITLAVCAGCLAAGFSLASFAASLWEIYMTYGVLCGFGVGLGYNSAISTAVKWFPAKSGLVSGISLMGCGFGAMALGTVAAALIGVMGWRATFLLIAAVFGAVMLAGAALLRPAAPSFLQHMSGHMTRQRQAVEDLPARQMITRRNFWFYVLWAGALSAAALAIINISTGYAGTFVGGDLSEAAAVAGIVSLANGAGRVAFGQLFDSKGYKTTMRVVTVCCLLAGAAFIAADISCSLWLLLAAFTFIGLSYGGVTPTNSAYTAYFFGRSHYALNFSITNLNLIVASYVGPLCASGEPMTAFFCMIALAAAACLCMMAIKPPPS